MSVVQIGAHTGFEQNDPIANVLSRLLKEVPAFVPHHISNEVRQNFHWTFIEPSSANFINVTGNLAKHSVLCDMRTVNAAVIPESLTEQDTTSGTTKRMVFYCTVVTTSDGECDGCKNFAPRTSTSTLTKSFVFSMLPTS